MRWLSLGVFSLLWVISVTSSAMASSAAGFSAPFYHLVGDGPNGIAVADFNRDGRLDFVSVDHWSHTITAFRGDGDATLDYSGQYPTTNYPDAIAAGDLDGDGFPEVATVGEYNSNVVAVFGNRGHSGHIRFKPQLLYPVGDSPSSVTMGDFDGDGNLDVAVGNRMTTDISVLLGNGDGTLQPQIRYGATGWPLAIVAADLDDDGDLDIAAVTSRVTILLNHGDGSFASPQHFQVGYMPFDLDIADFNSDGVPDIATANFWYGTVSVLIGNGDGTYQPHSILEVDPSNLENIVAGDFTGDGNADIIVSNGIWNTLSIFAGNGDGSFRSKLVLRGGSMQRALEKGDVDNDGDLDLFIAHLASDRVSVLLNLNGVR